MNNQVKDVEDIVDWVLNTPIIIDPQDVQAFRQEIIDKITTLTDKRVRERDEYWKAKIKKHFDAKIDEALSDQPKDL